MLNTISLTSLPNDIAKLILTDYFTPILSVIIKYGKPELTISYPYITTIIPLPRPYHSQDHIYIDHIQYIHNISAISLQEFIHHFQNNVPCILICKHGSLTIRLNDTIVIETDNHTTTLSNNRQTRQQVLTMWTEYLRLCREVIRADYH